MKKTNFYGSIWVNDFEFMNYILKKWLNTNSLETKIKLSEEEITYQNEFVSLYCHAADTSKNEEPSFLIEGSMDAKFDKAESMLQILAKLCADHQILWDLECVEVDEDGNEIGEQFYL